MYYVYQKKKTSKLLSGDTIEAKNNVIIMNLCIFSEVKKGIPSVDSEKSSEHSVCKISVDTATE